MGSDPFNFNPFMHNAIFSSKSAAIFLQAFIFLLSLTQPLLRDLMMLGFVLLSSCHQ